VHESRSDTKAYGFEMSDMEHFELATVLNQIKGRAVISGYRTKFYDELFKDWTRIDSEEKTINSSKGTRVESIWINF
jgi:DNA adenine methylase